MDIDQEAERLLHDDQSSIKSDKSQHLQLSLLSRASSSTSRKERLRAVLLTSFTTIGGLTPLLFEKSVQAQFLKPMAVTIVFGLLSSTFLVLILIPVLILVGSELKNIIFDSKNLVVTKQKKQ